MPLSSLWTDLRYAARRLTASPGFTAAAILTIALGIGLNAGVYSILNSILFSELPVPAADELVDILETVDGVPGRNPTNTAATTSEYVTFRDQVETLAGLAGYSEIRRVFHAGTESREIPMRYVTCNYFDVLRQPPVLGRGLVASDCDPGAAPVAVLDHYYWTRNFAADPSIIGRTIQLNRQPVTVVGISAEDVFRPLSLSVSVVVPISAQPSLRPDRQWLSAEDYGWLYLIGRRHNGSDVETVRAELDVIASRIDRQQSGRSTAILVQPSRILPVPPGYATLVASVVILIMMPFILILLTACANVANLCLARATTRSPETALRVSLGASRLRIVQQLLVETGLIALVGGAIGTALAYLSLAPLTDFVLSTSSLPVTLPEPQLDGRILAFVLVLSLATVAAVGLAPALQSSNPNLHTTTKHAAFNTGRQSGSRIQGVLVAGQVAISMALIIVTGVLLNALYDANTVDPGFPSEDITVVAGDLRGFGYEDEALVSFQRRLTEGIQALPGVEAVGLSAYLPWDARVTASPFSLRDDTDAVNRPMRYRIVEPGYFSALAIPIVRGREFTATDSLTSVLVSESAARRLWPEQDPLGQTLEISTEYIGGRHSDESWQVVGVVKDVHTVLGVTDPELFYRPVGTSLPHMFSFAVRSRGGFLSIERSIRDVIQGLDPNVAMNISPLDSNLQNLRLLSALVSGFSVTLGGMALALSAIGIFGVVAYVVGRRTREIGVRKALGAAPANILAAILKRTLQPVIIGALIGAIVTTGLLSRIPTIGVQDAYMDLDNDPLAICAAILFVLTIALLASVLPASRALRLDPMTTLREE